LNWRKPIFIIGSMMFVKRWMRRFRYPQMIRSNKVKIKDYKIQKEKFHKSEISHPKKYFKKLINQLKAFIQRKTE
jgi:hypothetical protein